MPQTLTSATYGTSNRLTQRAGANLSYDENGNLTNDGTNTYTWNARNQLVSISGSGLAASFQYDSFGNRYNKTVNSTSTSYLYDGDNIVQELSGTTPSANLLNGATDQVFNRTDASGARTPLADHLGSVLGLADDTGTLQTQYTYDPFGNTTSTGTTSTNTSKYTGREDDGTGLYYYRARYYSPTMQRFISEDPSGFAGGDTNLYAYVGNDPVNFVDPSGLCGVSALPGSFSGQRCRISTPTFDGLASDPRLAPAFDFLTNRFGARAEQVWSNWGHGLRAVFLNTTIAASAEGVALGRARFEGFLFSSKDGLPYGIYVSGLMTNDLGRLEFFRPDGSFRSPSSVPNGSVEAHRLSSGPNRGFWTLDVDLRNPNGNFVRHSLEVVRNLLTQQSTDPLAVAKVLQDRGIYTGVGCR
jgi:RHS repeat-associated protein